MQSNWHRNSPKRQQGLHSLSKRLSDCHWPWIHLVRRVLRSTNLTVTLTVNPTATFTVTLTVTVNEGGTLVPDSQ
jgi:hypothetical protein